jgi:hypothetical protein
MSNYVLNIVGSVLKYQDFSNAVSWIQRAFDEVDSKQFAEIMTAVFEELLDLTVQHPLMGIQEMGSSAERKSL